MAHIPATYQTPMSRGQTQSFRTQLKYALLQKALHDLHRQRCMLSTTYELLQNLPDAALLCFHVCLLHLTVSSYRVM